MNSKEEYLPLISVIMPTFNHDAYIAKAIQSVLEQTYQNLELVIVDNYSTDDTKKIVLSFSNPKIKFFQNDNQGVIAVSRNFGVKHAEGQYIAFLDSDDRWIPQKLEESLKYLSQGADIVYHDLYLVTKFGQRFFWRKAKTRQLKIPVFEDLIANGNALNTSSVVMRRELFDKIDGFSEDEDLLAVEDYDAWLRAAHETERFIRIPKILGYYWKGGGNISDPHRLLKNIEVITKRYNDLYKSRNNRVFPWVNYERGKAYYRLGSYELAKKYLKLVFFQGSYYGIQLKSLYILALVEFRGFF